MSSYAYWHMLYCDSELSTQAVYISGPEMPEIYFLNYVAHTFYTSKVTYFICESMLRCSCVLFKKKRSKERKRAKKKKTTRKKPAKNRETRENPTFSLFFRHRLILID
jgi:hypothetical protein